MKKMCTAALSLIYAASCILTAHAEEAESVTIRSEAKYPAGSTLVIEKKISVDDLGGVQLSLDYDHSKLKLDGIVTNAGHESVCETEKTLDWSTLLSPDGEKFSADDVLAKFKFKVIKDIDISTDVMNIHVEEAYDHNTDDIDYFSDGKIDVENNFTGKVGDIDNDGILTASDALTILRSSVDLYFLSPIEKPFADINEDNAIDASDALSVLRFSVGLSAGSDKLNTLKTTILSAYTIKL